MRIQISLLVKAIATLGLVLGVMSNGAQALPTNNCPGGTCTLAELTAAGTYIEFDDGTRAKDWGFVNNGAFTVDPTLIDVLPSFDALSGLKTLLFDAGTSIVTSLALIDFDYDYVISGGPGIVFNRAGLEIVDRGVGDNSTDGIFQLTKDVTSGATNLASLIAEINNPGTTESVEMMWVGDYGSISVSNNVMIDPNGDINVRLSKWKQTFVPEPSSAALFAANFALVGCVLRRRNARMR